MKGDRMSAMERVLTTLGHQEPDRVPLFLLLTMHGAKLFDTPIKRYFSNSEQVAEGQLKLRERYGHDCLYPFYYASLELEAWGGETIFFDDAPPNGGAPIITTLEQIKDLKAPEIDEHSPLLRSLKTIELLKREVGDTVPIIGVVISPFSLPVMQMGFDHYLDLIYNDRPLFERLMQHNIEFAVRWGNAQLAAGATAICYFDPVSSPTIIPPELYRKTGFRVAQKTISQLNGPTATHFASGITAPVIDDLVQTGTAVIGFSSHEDPGALKQLATKKISLLGSLNGIAMCNWSEAEAENRVKQLIQQAASGGGFILSDTHGEIPYQVSDRVLKAIVRGVERWGQYPVRGSL